MTNEQKDRHIHAMHETLVGYLTDENIAPLLQPDTNVDERMRKATAAMIIGGTVSYVFVQHIMNQVMRADHEVENLASEETVRLRFLVTVQQMDMLESVMAVAVSDEFRKHHTDEWQNLVESIRTVVDTDTDMPEVMFGILED